jgi:adenine deaminase
MKISGNIVDVLQGRIFGGTITVEDRRIAEVTETRSHYGKFIIPGFVDSHFHVESTMLVPSEVGRLAVAHGTVAMVCDPHEIGNVLGTEGVGYMIEEGRLSPLKFYFGAPSCVPATIFETSGANIGVREVEDLLRMREVLFLSEVMDYPGVLSGNPSIMAKIAAAKRLGKKIDGHAPGLHGEDARRYIEAGISTDHECTTLDEAVGKLRYGMKILIREGSAAKNLHDLLHLMGWYPDFCMFCSDDLHPGDLIAGHINRLAREALRHGTDIMSVLRCACVNPVQHYGLDVGLLQKEDRADFLVVDNLEELNILETYIDGNMIARDGRPLLDFSKPPTINRFNALQKSPESFALKGQGSAMQVIAAIDGQVVTEHLIVKPLVRSGFLVPDPSRDILKIAVVNRYQDVPPAIGFVRGFGMKTGALASSVAHDSHNIVAVGVEDEALCMAVNAVIECGGGISVARNDRCDILPLPVAGLMSDRTGPEVADEYARIEDLAKHLGSHLHSPFMTLSFMALLVIPKLKLSDKGLFDGEKFQFTDLIVP